MLEPVSRLTLWRFAVHLAHKTLKPPWEGPFHQAGYTTFVVEASFYNRVGSGYTPDIAIIGAEDWAILELTTSPRSKTAQIARYRTLAPEYIAADHALPIPDGRRPPIPIVVRTQADVPDGCPQIIVGDEVTTRDVDDVPDQLLREKLQALNGTKLGHLPQSRLAFVPESSQREIRQGLVPSIKSVLFSPGSSATVHSLAQEGLDFLWDRVSAPGRTQLMGKVREAMDALVTPAGGPLRDYLSVDDTGYRATSAEVLHPRSMVPVEELLADWIRRSPYGRRSALPEFDDNP